jgi:hypothetical protein
MMAELVQKLSDKTGLSPEKSQEVINVVVTHLKEKLPVPMASGLDSILADGSAGTGGSMLDEAKSAVSELSSIFGKTAGA